MPSPCEKWQALRISYHNLTKWAHGDLRPTSAIAYKPVVYISWNGKVSQDLQEAVHPAGQCISSPGFEISLLEYYGQQFGRQRRKLPEGVFPATRLPLLRCQVSGFSASHMVQAEELTAHLHLSWPSLAKQEDEY